MIYKARHMRQLLGKSHEAIRSWTVEFADYLSPGANPGQGQHRIFTPEDVAVLVLVKELRDRGQTFKEIQFSLQSGQRGDLPTLAPEELDAQQTGIVDAEATRQILRLRQALDRAEADLAVLGDVQEENIRLKADLEAEQRRNTELQAQVERQKQELVEQIERLSREIGREYAKGYVDALSQQPKPRRDEDGNS